MNAHQTEVQGLWTEIQRLRDLLAKPMPEYLRITAFVQVEGTWIAETDCHDFAEYKALPAAIEVKGIRLGKTGWSSDRQYACYKADALLGTHV